MQENTKQTELLNNLIVINNDRIKGYEKAVEDAADIDVDLKKLFSDLADKSKKFKAELVEYISGLEGEVKEEGNSFSAGIYRAWMDVKTLFSGRDRRTVLEICKDGEDAAIDAYKTVLANEELTDKNARDLVNAQISVLNDDREMLKKMIAEH